MSNIITLPLIKTPSPLPLVRPYSRPIIIHDKSLIAYYVFDREGKLMDLSGNGNHGTITGATFNAKGRYGAALSFDGLDDYVDLMPESSFDFGANQDFSFWMWFYPNTAADTRYLYSKNFNNLATWISSTDTILAKIDDTVTSKNVTTDAVIEGAWNFFCATYNRDGNLSGYLNADTPVTVDISGVGDINNNSVMRIGSASTPLDGQTDAFGCIKRVLTAIEVKGLYEAGL
jgi:hypothetical protein